MKDKTMITIATIQARSITTATIKAVKDPQLLQAMRTSIRLGQAELVRRQQKRRTILYRIKKLLGQEVRPI